MQRVYDTDGVSPVIETPSGGGKMPKIEVTGTLGKETQHYKVYSGGGSGTVTREGKDMSNEGLRIRYLTPRECLRLMGQSDDAIDRIMEAEPSKTVEYRLAGNSIVVDVLVEIFKGIYIDNDFEKPKPKQTSLGAFA